MTIRMLVAMAALGFLAACTGGDETTIRACKYEERQTDGCDGMGFGPWVPGCAEFDAANYTISDDEVCGNLTQSGLSCSAGCCVDYEFRNVILEKGPCTQ